MHPPPPQETLEKSGNTDFFRKHRKKQEFTFFPPNFLMLYIQFCITIFLVYDRNIEKLKYELTFLYSKL